MIIESYSDGGGLSTDMPTHTCTCQYENADDKDQLTSYDGKAITYDKDGNVPTYNGWAYT